MSSIIKPLYELILQMLTSEERLEPYRMSQRQISQIFAWLDQRRRGYVDVSDFYAKFPQLSQSQLFYVFKFLDTSRKGAFTHQDLQTALSLKSSCDRDPQDDAIRSFTNLIRVLKATFHLLQQQRRKSSITNTMLEQIFQKACQKKKDKIDITDLVVLFKQAALQVNQKILSFLRNKIFCKSALNAKQFLQIFSQFLWNEDIGITQANVKHMLDEKIQSSGSYLQNRANEKIKNTDKINSQIDKILQKYRNPTPELNSIPERKQQSENNTLELNSYLKRSQNRNPSRYTHGHQTKVSETNLKTLPWQPRQQRQISKYDYLRTSTEAEPSLNRYQNYLTAPGNIGQNYTQTGTPLSYVQMNRRRQEFGLMNSPSKVANVGQSYSPSCPQGYTEISRRRQELRKGSLERQKIIDDLMNKKKLEYSGHSKPGSLYTHNLKIETKFEEPEVNYIHGHINNRAATPTSKLTDPRLNYENSFIGKLYENPSVERQFQYRPSSATKTSTLYEKSYFNKQDHSSKPDLIQFYRKATETPKNSMQEKENILRKAEQQATKKIQQIERRAKLKVMQKRSVAGVYNRWLK